MWVGGRVGGGLRGCVVWRAGGRWGGAGGWLRGCFVRPFGLGFRAWGAKPEAQHPIP